MESSQLWKFPEFCFYFILFSFILWNNYQFKCSFKILLSLNFVYLMLNSLQNLRSIHSFWRCTVKTTLCISVAMLSFYIWELCDIPLTVFSTGLGLNGIRFAWFLNAALILFISESKSTSWGPAVNSALTCISCTNADLLMSTFKVIKTQDTKNDGENWIDLLLTMQNRNSVFPDKSIRVVSLSHLLLCG